MVGVANDELVVHAAAFAVGAGVGDNGVVQAGQADVGVLALVNPADLHAVGRGRVERFLEGLVVEIVRSHIQRVLGACDPCGHGVVHVCAQRQRKLVGGHAVVDRSVEVHVDVSRALRHRRVGTDAGSCFGTVLQRTHGARIDNGAWLETGEVGFVAWGVGAAHGHFAQGFGQSIFNDPVARQVCGPRQGEAGGGHVGLHHRRGEAQRRRGNQVHRATWEQLVAAKSVERKLRHDAQHVHFTAGQLFAHQAVAGAHVNDARLPRCGEIVGVVACDERARQRERHAVDAHELSFQVLAHLCRRDLERLRQGARPKEFHSCEVGAHFQQPVVFGDFPCHTQAVANLRCRVPRGPVLTRVKRDARCGVLQVAHRPKVVVACHHTGDRHGLSDVVVLAHVENVLLRHRSEGSEGGREGQGQFQIHGLGVLFCSPFNSSTALKRTMRGGPTKTSARPLPPSNP